MFDTKIFKERLRSSREAAGLKQDEFAEKVGIARASASYYENQGNKALPNAEVLYNMAEVLNVSFDYLLGKSECKKRENIDILERTGLSEKAVDYLCNMNKVAFRNGMIATYDSKNMCPSKIISLILENELFDEFMTAIQCCLFQINKEVQQIEYTPEVWRVIHSLRSAGDSLIDSGDLSRFKLMQAEKIMSQLLDEIVPIDKDDDWKSMSSTEEESLRSTAENEGTLDSNDSNAEKS